MKKHVRLLGLSLLFAVCATAGSPYRDTTHLSRVFSMQKSYRIYLPSDYHRSGERYPVIYFFHGWGGRHFKDDSANLGYELLGPLVDRHRTVLVMWDGNIDPSEPRPYNVGNHDDVKYSVQMKDYFPELISHIDSTYRTIADREHRGIIGFSMGGFMAAFLAGKYPDKVSTIVNMVGSPEFFVGTPDHHTLYTVRHSLDNLDGLALCFYATDNCPLYYMSEEIDRTARWKGLQNYTWWPVEGDHRIDNPGETVTFDRAMEFVAGNFGKSPVRKNYWSHHDLYAGFEVWNYRVESDKNRPGFISLDDVSPAGFTITTRKWLPDGPSFPLRASVTTAPVYRKGRSYSVYFHRGGERPDRSFTRKADQEGRLHFTDLTEGTRVVIAAKGLSADFVVDAYRLDPPARKMLLPDTPNRVTLDLLQRGEGLKNGSVTVSVTCLDSTVTLRNGLQTIPLSRPGATLQTQPMELTTAGNPPVDASPYWVRCEVEFRHGGETCRDEVLLPVCYDVPLFKHVKVDDGVGVRSVPLGTGNGNGQAEPSERIVLYENYQRLRLFTDDPYVDRSSEELFHDMLTAGIWPDGYTSGSVVRIAGNCPPGHTIEFLASYETKTFMPIRRQVVWGKVRLTVK